ncbi:hypothetical protein J5491_00450 [Candidatus Saccharibacteria bacterium]|nr:hypothetical protein [Candidatus Saccharibacteria bacterium]
MIRIFTGDDRVRASQEIAKKLGDSYEIIEGADLTPDALPSVFLGNSLFSDQRKILIRDISTNKLVFEKLPDYLDTPHDVIIQELKLDKRSSAYKAIKDKVEIKDFPLPENPNLRLVFDIYKTAKTDGKKAVEMLEKIKTEEDPIMFFGLLTSQAIKDYNNRQGTKEKRVLRELAKLDLSLKSSSHDPWLLIEAFLLLLRSF